MKDSIKLNEKQMEYFKNFVKEKYDLLIENPDPVCKLRLDRDPFNKVYEFKLGKNYILFITTEDINKIEL